MSDDEIMEGFRSLQEAIALGFSALEAKMDARFDRLERRMDRLEQRVEKLEQRVGRLEHEVAVLGHEVGQLTLRIERLERTVADHTLRIGSIELHLRQGPVA